MIRLRGSGPCSLLLAGLRPQPWERTVVLGKERSSWGTDHDPGERTAPGTEGVAPRLCDSLLPFATTRALREAPSSSDKNT